MKTTQILIGLITVGSLAMAGNVTIPNSFTAGTAAKASEVNANFSAVKTAVDGNAADVLTNKGKISDNTAAIDAKQKKITGNCTTGSYIQKINADGTVVCAEDKDSGAQMWVRDHEGNIHPTVKIGSQVWMADNMYVTTYPDGTDIESGDWSDGDDDDFAYPIKKASNYEGSDDTPVAKKGDLDIKQYGLFYQWKAAVHGDTDGTAQGICPEGWHIPSSDDWDALQRALGSTTFVDSNWQNGGDTDGKIGDQLKRGGKSGFNAVFAGELFDNGTNYAFRGTQTYFWTSNDKDAADAYSRGLKNNLSGFVRGNTGKTRGISVRCLKD